MSGRLVGAFIMIAAVFSGAALYYLQVYGFYHEIADSDGPDVQLVLRVSGEPEPIAYADFRAIDADSSPIRYRACFTTPLRHAMLSETYQMVEGVIPRNAPGWFDCFDAVALGAELEAGTALSFIGIKNIAYGVDRIVAITEDGRGFVWHELNDCGEKAYDGTVVGEDCPDRPGAATEGE